MKIYVINCCKRIKEEIYNVLLGFLSVDERDRIRQFYKWEDAQRALISRVMIRSLISKKFGPKISDIKIRNNRFGKPYINNEKFHFNLSHSGDWIVCITDSDRVGIDIEEIVEVDLEEISKFFSENEQLDLMLVNKCKRSDFFFDLWSLKESYIKAVGEGLSIKLASFSIRKTSHSIHIEGGEGEYYFKQYDIDSAYKLSICAKSQNFPEGVVLLTLDDLMSYLPK